MLAPCCNDTCPKVQEVLGSLSGQLWSVPRTSFLGSGSMPPPAEPPILGHGCAGRVRARAGERDGSLGALPGRAEARKQQCGQKTFVLKAAGPAQPSQSSLCPGCACSLVDGSALTQSSPSPQAQAGSVGLALSCFQSPAPNTEQTLDSC